MIKHLACIMSGNRTWARSKGWLPWMGYKEGVQAIKRVIDFCLENKIPYLSLYTFSIENFKRPAEEQNYMFNILAKEESDNLLAQALEKGVRVQFIGDRSLFPASVAPLWQKIEEKTADLKNLTVNFLFCYGGRQEIMAGVKQVIHKIKIGEMKEEDLSPELFGKQLWTHDMPDPDLIIRTDRYQRLSNFLLYQAAYAELYFLDCMWPAITREHLNDALNYFNTVKRNFGA